MEKDFVKVDEEDIAQVYETAPGHVHVRTVHVTVWRRRMGTLEQGT